MADGAGAKKAQPWYLAVAPHLWGSGHSVDEAKKNLRKQGADLRKQYVVYRMPNGACDPYVNGMGRVCWSWEDGADKTKGPEEIFRRGAKQ